jgi:hypothetical protein
MQSETQNQNFDPEKVKRLRLHRHSKKDARSDISAEGLKMARALGLEDGRSSNPDVFLPDLVFCGPFSRCSQTALAYCGGFVRMADYMPEFKPVIYGLGDPDLFASIDTTHFRHALKNGAGQFEAALRVHGEEQIQTWAGRALLAVNEMFLQMDLGDSAIGFFHSPTIEFIVWALSNQSLPDEFRTLNELEGVEIIASGNMAKDILSLRKLSFEAAVVLD